MIDGSVDISENSNTLDQTKKAIRETNEIVYCCVLYRMNDNICFNLVDTAKTKDLPDGDAALAWKNLLTIYEPKQFGSLLTLKNEFLKRLLRTVDNPQTFCT